jgi:hypothetical protein
MYRSEGSECVFHKEKHNGKKIEGQEDGTEKQNNLQGNTENAIVIPGIECQCNQNNKDYIDYHSWI